MKKLLLTLILSIFCYAQQTEGIKSPAQIQAEIDQAQRDFEIAKKMFIPWYTGPLITGSASNVPPGKYVLQPYLFGIWQYAAFNADRKSISIPDLYTIQATLIAQAGLLERLDFTIAPQGFFRWQSGRSATGFGDTSLTFGLQIVKETPYIPNIRITVGESFPSGRYENLSSNKGGIDATGSGAYTTIVGLNVSKVFWWIPLHPIRARFSGNFSLPNHRVHVHKFNAYGGGFGTDGKVKVGSSMNLDLGIEVSINQRWVFANDFAYSYGWSSSFSGLVGIDATGMPAQVGTPSSNQFSLAPAIEYNRTDSDGFIGGVWFATTGRNSSNFAALVVSYYVVF